MGHITHHAIIVTTFDKPKAEAARRKARTIFPEVSSIVKCTVNSYFSFLIPPDGSKSGWNESDLGDQRRAKFIAWLDEQAYEDGSTAYEWIEVQYGSDDVGCGRKPSVTNYHKKRGKK